MSAKLKVAEIAELALGKIGAYTVAMVAPDPDEMVRTVKWMDVLVGQLAESVRLFWLTPVTTTSTLTANVASYTLSALLGSSYPTDGIAFPVAAFIRDSSGRDSRIDIVSRNDYEELDNSTETGTPALIYIDRLNSTQKIYIHPIPTDSTFSLRLEFQTFAPDLTGGTPSAGGNIGHGFSSGWQRWLIIATAAEIGDGPVRRLPLQEIGMMKNDAAQTLRELITYANTQKTTTPKRTKAAI